MLGVLACLGGYATLSRPTTYNADYQLYLYAIVGDLADWCQSSLVPLLRVLWAGEYDLPSLRFLCRTFGYTTGWANPYGPMDQSAEILVCWLVSRQMPFLRFATFISLLAFEDDGFMGLADGFIWEQVLSISLRVCILVGVDGVAISPAKLVDFFFHKTGRSLWADRAWIEAHRIEQRRRNGAGIRQGPATVEWFVQGWAERLASEFPICIPPFVWPSDGNNGVVLRGNFAAGGYTPSSSEALAREGMTMCYALRVSPYTPPNTPTADASEELIELRHFRGLPPDECKQIENRMVELRRKARLALGGHLCRFGPELIPAGHFARDPRAQRSGLLPASILLEIPTAPTEAQLIQLFPSTTLLVGVPEVRYRSASLRASNFLDPNVRALVHFVPGMFVTSDSAVVAALEVLTARTAALDIFEERAAPPPSPAVSSSSSSAGSPIRIPPRFAADLLSFHTHLRDFLEPLARSPVSPVFSPFSSAPSSPELLATPPPTPAPLRLPAPATPRQSYAAPPAPSLYGAPTLRTGIQHPLAGGHPPTVASLSSPSSDEATVPESPPPQNGHHSPPAPASPVDSASSLDPEYSPPLPANGQ
jgi:hypothetical protein